MGKWDLIFADGKGSFLIVEYKYINNNKTGTTTRNKVYKQAKRYASLFKDKYPLFQVLAIAYTNEKLQIIHLNNF